MPEVYRVLDNFLWTANDIGQVMIWNQEKDSSPYQNAKRWVKENPDKVKRWISQSNHILEIGFVQQIRFFLVNKPTPIGLQC